TVVFDKTGTLTAGRPKFSVEGNADRETLALAASIAAHSRHPYSLALAALDEGRKPVALEEVTEHPGAGLEARSGGSVYRLGRPDWAAGGQASSHAVVLSKDGLRLAAFHLSDHPRSGARNAIAELRQSGLRLEILSGDSASRVDALANELGGLPATSGARPADKVSHIERLRSVGHKILM